MFFLHFFAILCAKRDLITNECHLCIAQVNTLILYILSITHNRKKVLTTGCEGKNGARCFFTPIGPMPGPPPP